MKDWQYTPARKKRKDLVYNKRNTKCKHLKGNDFSLKIIFYSTPLHKRIRNRQNYVKAIDFGWQYSVSKILFVISNSI